MQNKIIPLRFGNFSVIDSNLSRMRQQLHDQFEKISNSIQQDGNEKVMKLTFDVSQFSPEEVKVETENGKIIVHAKHVEKTKNRSIINEFKQEFSLPEGVDSNSMDVQLSNDRVLVVKVPLKGEAFEAIAN